MFKIFKNLSPFSGTLTLVLFLLIFQSLADLYLPTLMSDIVDIGIIQGNTSYIYKQGLFMLAVSITSAAAMIYSSFLSARVATGLGKILRSKVFSRIESYSLNEFNLFGTASLITRTTNDVNQVQQVLIVILRMMVTAPITCIGGIALAVAKDAKLSGIFAIILPLLTIVLFLIAKKGIPLFNAMQIKTDTLNRIFREGLTGVKVIRAFDQGEYEEARFSQANRDFTDTSIRVNRLMASTMPLMMLIMNVSTIAIVWFGGIRIDHGNMQVGDLMAFIQYAMLIMFSLVMMSFIFIMIPRAEASAKRINEVLDIIPEISDSEETKTPSHNSGQLEFKNVVFRYPGAEDPALSKVSFTAQAGKTTAIIGGTGSGKSTLANLILRFYDVEQGEILLNGIDIRHMSQKDLRSRIGFVSQKTVLFSGTVSENIQYGKITASENEIIQAAGMAQATEFINEAKDNYNFIISQGGSNVSGGQKQRIAIARALIRKPEIYLFDDSFSALDYKTDQQLRSALKKDTERTTIIIAQRVSTVMEADQIIVLDQGEVISTGKHTELINSCSIYREIVSSQFSEEEIS
ncbi:MAG: ABC transporter ATP-binding protein [Peptococcaceae bacterium]|nr:ABC transporter ATP-binding protein [Peptococcaceae bacterium]